MVGILAFGGWMGGAEYQKNYSFPKGMAVAMVNGDSDKGANGWIESDSKVLKKEKCEVESFHFPGGHSMAPPDVIDEAIAWILEQSLPE